MSNSATLTDTKAAQPNTDSNAAAEETVVQNGQTPTSTKYKYTDALALLQKIDNREVKVTEIESKIEKLKKTIRSSKLCDSDGSILTEYDDLKKVVEEVKSYKWDIGTYPYTDGIVKVFETKASVDIGGIITSKVNSLRSALMTPKRTKEWALSDEMSSPNWDVEGDAKTVLIEEIDQKFAEVTAELTEWVKQKSVTTEDGENKRKRLWGDKNLAKGDSQSKKEWAAHKLKKGWTKSK